MNWDSSSSILPMVLSSRSQLISPKGSNVCKCVDLQFSYREVVPKMDLNERGVVPRGIRTYLIMSICSSKWSINQSFGMLAYHEMLLPTTGESTNICFINIVTQIMTSWVKLGATQPFSTWVCYEVSCPNMETERICASLLSSKYRVVLLTVF